MGVKQTSSYCHTCQRQSMFQKPGINHLLHLILSVVTLGFWLFVWLILAIIAAGKPERCVTCGMPKGLGAGMGTPTAAMPQQPLPPAAAPEAMPPPPPPPPPPTAGQP